MKPSYIGLLENNLFDDRLERLREYYSEGCRVCPVECGALRSQGEKGFCGVAGEVLISSWNLHHGEEPPISGSGGSGTIFFAGCSLKCVYCQNYPISQLMNGKKYSVTEMADMMLALQEKGAHNINFVTPTHYTVQIVEALKMAAEMGLKIPLVWNSSGYENIEVIRLLDEIVDIYLPDMKFVSPKNSNHVSGREDYFEVTLPVIREMFSQVGRLEVDEAGIALRGVLVRHLVLPGDISDTFEVIKYAKEISPEMNMSVMSQYFPAHEALQDERLNRKLTRKEYSRVLKYLEKMQMENIFIQEL